jgi:hypothetical protein
VPKYAYAQFAPKKTFFKDADVSELARTLRDAFSRIPILSIVTMEGPYTEPLYLGYDHEPAGVMILRVQNISDYMEVPLKTGGTTHFVWDGTRSRCRIDSIDGMTPTEGATYRFTFLMIG